MLAFVIISLTILTIAIYGASQIILINNAFFWSAHYWTKHESKFDIWSDLFFTKARTLNSWGSNSDSLKCLSWVLRISWSSGNCFDSSKVHPAPQTFWQISWSDWIEDDFDNNDYKCTFASDSDYVKIDKINSKKCDNDDEHRVYISWIIPPWETVTALSLTPDLFEIIANNKNNIWPNVRRSLPENTSFKIKMDVSWTGLEMEIYEIDKNILDSRKIIYTTNKISGTITSTSWIVKDNWSLTWGGDFLFNTSSKYYALLLTNTWNEIKTFKLYWEKSWWDLVYLNPINDDLELIEYTKAVYTKVKDDLIYKTKLFYVEK